MAVYAGVVSLMNLMEQVQLYHNQHPVFDENQQRQLESLHEQVSFLLDFLESYSQEVSDQAQSLESRIVDAAYAAESVIESSIVNDIHGRSGKVHLKKSPISNFSQDMQNIIENIESIKRDVIETKIESRLLKDPQAGQELERVSSSRLPTIQKDIVVGIDDVMNQIMDQLTSQQSNLQIIPVTGMGGIGKTTLAINVYNNPVIVQCFHVRGWVTISQEYSIKEILLGLLCELKVLKGKENFECHQLGEKLYKHLSGRRYLIILDDIWSLEPWDKIKVFLPNNDNGSRVMVTTRHCNVANSIGTSNMYRMNFLDENESWSLLERKVFNQKSCPLELLEIGRKIATNCKGLPLSIIVVGGLLAKSMKQEYWESVAEDTTGVLNSDDGDHCLRILFMSYNHLPIHLKPCFLYLGVFPEDNHISVSRLIRLWVAEGFLKPKKTKTMEEVANDYLHEFIDRNLVYVSKCSSTGPMKRCRMHDLLRDLCMREAQKHKFLYVTKLHHSETSQDFTSQHRVAIHSRMSHVKYSCEVHRALELPALRSFMCNFRQGSQPSLNDTKLLRVWTVNNSHCHEFFSKLVNLRYVDFGIIRRSSVLDRSISLLWNLQTIIASTGLLYIVLPSTIWGMPTLRHVKINNVYIEEPPAGERGDNIVLNNLQTISNVVNFECSDVILRKIPNVKKLQIMYQANKTLSPRYLQNLGRLEKLESLRCMFLRTIRSDFFRNVEFSQSLKKLILHGCVFEWDEIGTKIGSLPRLKKLKLISCKGGEEWNSVEGQFLCLEFLEIKKSDLVRWTAESTHFPRLEHLSLSDMHELKEIPSGIGDIPTMRSIKVTGSCNSVIASAQRILEEQREFGNEDLHLIT